ncbi:aldo-keto reductase [Fusarium oxysporum f. sp. albedinis]|nr:aldo-keto reductase [Fusarium oxysporum f. sp. albedinis]
MALKFSTRRLGVNGPLVTSLGYGAMGLSTAYGPPKTDQERFAMLDHVYESGVGFWDTSDSYGDSEDLLGRWFKRNPGARESIFLATKFGVYSNTETGERAFRNDPEYIKQACEKSLNSLGVDHIDLYYCHRIQTDQPIEITVREMNKLQDAGKIKYLGLSECSATTLRRACKVAQISAVQIEYSPFSMDIEDPEIGLLAACRELGVAVVAYSPLGRGFLTGAIRSPDDFKAGDARKSFPRFSEDNFSKNLKLVDILTSLAQEKGCTPAQLVLAFLQAQGEYIIPIPGSTSPGNWDENVGCAQVAISSDDNGKIRQAVAATQVHGHRLPPAFSQSLFADTVPLES